MNNKRVRVIKLQDAKAKMRELGEYFSFVRLIDEQTISGKGAPITLSETNLYCYEALGKDTPCQNCVAETCLKTKKDQRKLCIFNDKFFNVIAKYYEIDGKPYVMELIEDFGKNAPVDIYKSPFQDQSLNEYYSRSYTDSLTGCYNRRYFEERVDVSFNGGIALMDLDDFKLYNDVYGHGAGDTVLKAVTNTLLGCLRPKDKLIRYGGDEFLLLAPDISLPDFVAILTKMRSRVGNLTLNGLTGLSSNVSIGGVIADKEPISKAVSRADGLMYVAKRENRGIVTDADDLKSSSVFEKRKILVVDDSSLNREMLSLILQNEFTIVEAEDGISCIEKLTEYNEFSAVLLDLIMPKADGFVVLEYMKAHSMTDILPVIIITSDESDSSVAKAYELGIADYIQRPFDVKAVYKRVVNTIALYAKQKRLIDHVNEQMAEREKEIQIMTAVLGEIAEFREPDGYSHVMKIRKLAEMFFDKLLILTDRYNLQKSEIVRIINASALHDIGKIAIDKNILNKRGKLTEEEFNEIKKHTVIGASMIRKIDPELKEPILRCAYDICLYHHERYDGSGYPKGLKGDDIPVSAQVIAICDVYTALTDKRAYKEAYSHEESIKMILDGECGQFNPLLLKCLKDLDNELKDFKLSEKTNDEN